MTYDPNERIHATISASWKSRALNAEEMVEKLERHNKHLRSRLDRDVHNERVRTAQAVAEKNELRDVLFELCDAIAEGGYLVDQRGTPGKERLVQAYQRAIDIVY